MKNDEVIALQVTRGRGIGECLRFLEKLKETCKNNPTVYTDRGPWYNWPMKFLKIGGDRNLGSYSERWIASWVALS